MPELNSKPTAALRIVCGVLAITCLVWAQLHSPLRELHAGYILNSAGSLWMTISNLDYLATFTWNIDPFSRLAFDAERYLALGGFGLPLFILTCWVYWSNLVRPTLALSLTVIIVCYLLAHFGVDPILFSSLASLPLGLLSLRFAASSKPPISLWFFTPVFGCLLALSANQLALMLVLLAATWSAYNLKIARPALFFVATTLLIAPACMLLALTPLPTLPDYPASVLPMSLVTDLGGHNILDRQFIRYIFGRPLVITSVVAVLVLLLSRPEPQGYRSRRPLYFTATLLVLGALDCLAPEQVSQSSPLTGFARLVPGSFSIPLLPFYFATLIFLISSTVLQHCKQLAIFIWFAVLTALLFAPLRANQALPYFNKHSPERLALLTSTTCPEHAQVQSRSIPVWLKLKGRLACIPNDLIVKLSGTEANITVTSSRPDKPRLTQRLIDGNFAKNWRTREGATANDWIGLSFEQSEKLVAVIMYEPADTEAQPQTYQVQVSSSCGGSSDSSTDWKTADTITIQPTIDLTPSGFYFFGKPGNSIIFNRTENAKCIKVSPASNFAAPWRINEIIVITVKQS